MRIGLIGGNAHRLRGFVCLLCVTENDVYTTEEILNSVPPLFKEHYRHKLHPIPCNSRTEGAAALFRQVERIMNEVRELIVIADDLDPIVTHALAYGKITNTCVVILPQEERFFSSLIEKNVKVPSSSPST